MYLDHMWGKELRSGAMMNTDIADNYTVLSISIGESIERNN